jgi:hypothetical protein
MVQARLPKKYFDYSLYDNLIEDLLDLEKRNIETITANIYFDNLAVVYCGQYVKYGYLVPVKKKSRTRFSMDFVLEGKRMKEMHSHLSDSIEIIKVVETAHTNWLQIICKDHAEDIFSIITWDFNNNLEQNIF